MSQPTPVNRRQRPLDDTDRALLAALRDRGRASFADLARLVGLSAPSVQERVARLEQTGTIRGFHADVDPAAAGLGVLALVGVFLGEVCDQDDVRVRLAEIPEVESCWAVAGEETFVLLVRAADIDGLEGTLRVLRRTPGISRTRTTVVLSTAFEGRPTWTTAPEGLGQSASQVEEKSVPETGRPKR